MRVLQDNPFSAFRGLPLLRHALFPSGFHLQVNPMTQKPPSEFLLTASGIQHRVPRRTLSPHTAQASHLRLGEQSFLDGLSSIPPSTADGNTDARVPDCFASPIYLRSEG